MLLGYKVTVDGGIETVVQPWLSSFREIFAWYIDRYFVKVSVYSCICLFLCTCLGSQMYIKNIAVPFVMWLNTQITTTSDRKTSAGVVWWASGNTEPAGVGCPRCGDNGPHGTSSTTAPQSWTTSGGSGVGASLG